MWERFSYYGMRSLLIYYMIKHLHFTQERSSGIYGLYTGFVYFTPLFGGMLADRFLGQRRTVVLGRALMAIGHFLMAADDGCLVPFELFRQLLVRISRDLLGKMPRENFFLLMFALSFAAGLAFFALLKPLKKAIGQGKRAAA